MATTKQKTLFKFTVVGSGVFPFDMLRYDQCWPASENDSAAIERTSRRGRMIAQEVTDVIEEQYDIEREAAMLGVTRERFIDHMLPTDNRWIPVMSDTPCELEGHREAIEEGHGRVLVTGLGLGVVISGLLAKPDVERIDVIEIDRDVIALTGSRYPDPRLHIHEGSADDPSCLPPDLRWDYAWHDIWTHVAERNLDNETAEHGISYYHLFEIWSSRVPHQGAWALSEAIRSRAANEQIRARHIAWYEALLAADENTQIEMLQDKVISENHPDIHPITDEVRRLFDPDGKFVAHLRRRLRHEPGFLTGMRAIAEQDLNGGEPLGRPNEEVSL
jgi:hypothetical protein